MVKWIGGKKTHGQYGLQFFKVCHVEDQKHLVFDTQGNIVTEESVSLDSHNLCMCNFQLVLHLYRYSCLGK
jgi:hypothetical protein